MFWWRQQVADGLWVAFTDAGAGNLALHVGDDAAAVRQRRSRLAVAMGKPPESLLFMNQVHSTHVVWADQLVPAGPSGDGDARPGADAMVSPGGLSPMAVMVADCVPVVLAGFSPDTGEVAGTAVVHAGRQGLSDGIVSAAVRELQRTGTGELDLRAWIGPAICGRCYEVPEEMADSVAAQVPGTKTTTRQGTPGLELSRGVGTQLAGLGVVVEQIAGCTMEESRLFSYRRDHQTGRFAGLVWREQTG
ncbi:MAG TPA: peptidoglycan editing factor PgeF [Arthrobacter sp.]|nr:peptidoglycan editing factor PgeF [Arthrobacter sp.]